MKLINAEGIQMGKLSTEYVDLRDIKLAYREYGNGPTVILLHGNSENKKIFEKYQLIYFTEYTTIAVDSRGHGQSISNDNEYSIKQYADDIVRLCQAKGIKESYVIGYSDGANIALIFAFIAPQIFKKVLAISPNYLASGVKDSYLRLTRGGVKILEFLGKCGFHTQKAIMRFMLVLNDIGITDAELSSIQTSIEVLYAENDAIKEEHIKHIGYLIPHSNIKMIKNCNHMTILNKAETVNEIKEYFGRS